MKTTEASNIVIAAVMTVIYVYLRKYASELEATGFLVFIGVWFTSKIVDAVNKPIKISLGMPDPQQEGGQQEKVPAAPAKNPIGFLWDGK